MPKSTRKEASNKPIMARLSSWGREWKADFATRASQAGRQFFGCLGTSAVIIFILAIGLYYLVLPHFGVSLPGGPGVLEWGIQMAILIVFLYLFIPYLALLFILSLHPKTRPVADKLSLGFFGQTELDKLKEQVESGLRSTNERIDKELKGIDNRLGDIEATLIPRDGKKNKKNKKGNGR